MNTCYPSNPLPTLNGSVCSRWLWRVWVAVWFSSHSNQPTTWHSFDLANWARSVAHWPFMDKGSSKRRELSAALTVRLHAALVLDTTDNHPAPHWASHLGERERERARGRGCGEREKVWKGGVCELYALSVRRHCLLCSILSNETETSSMHSAGYRMTSLFSSY